MNALVGYTGFVGSNIYLEGKIDRAFNSSNIESSYGLEPDLLIYAGLRAEKYLANNNPEKDMELIYQAEDNIKKINPKKLVLISTIDVFKNPTDMDEYSYIDCDNLQPYGFNRYQLECWVRKNYPDALIIRLPGLYGINIKKNFIYDYVNIIPFMLTESKYLELEKCEPLIKEYYESQNNGYYKCRELNNEVKKKVKLMFKELGFSALNFTDSRNIYQFYPLKRLWDDICIALRNGLHVWHPATEPVSVSELYTYLSGKKFINELAGIPVYYNYKTAYFKLFGGNNGYILSKKEILDSIKQFVRMYE